MGHPAASGPVAGGPSQYKGERVQTQMAKAKTIVRREPATTLMVETPLIEKTHKVSRDLTKSLADDLAHDLFYYKNYAVEEFRLLSKYHYRNFHVSRMYPNARGGRLYIDEWQGEWENEAVEFKKKASKELKFRYVVLYPGMTFEQAMLELEEVTRGLANGTQ